MQKQPDQGECLGTGGGKGCQGQGVVGQGVRELPRLDIVLILILAWIEQIQKEGQGGSYKELLGCLQSLEIGETFSETLGCSFFENRGWLLGLIH